MASTSERPDVLILGGGLAGLACAVALAEGGARATVLERRPHLGGRAYSFRDPETGQMIDNGQHLFMGCYDETRRFLGRIGASSRLRFARRVSVTFAEPGGGLDRLTCPPWLGAPWHLAWGVWGLRGLTARDKWSLGRLHRELARIRGRETPAALDRLTVRGWLDELGLSRRLQERLLDPVALAVLNDEPTVAAATGFVQAMGQMFYRDFESSRLGLASVGLSELYAADAARFIEERGGRVLTSRRAAALVSEHGRVSGVRTEDGEVVAAGAVVSTLAAWDLARLDRPAVLRGAWEGLRASPIVSVHLWLDRPVLDEPMVGLLGTESHWAFNRSAILGLGGEGQHLSVVISGARRAVARDPKELLTAVERDLALCLPSFEGVRVRSWRVIKEPRATLSPVPGSESARPAPGNVLPGLFLAGDWTRTGLPATIESAVCSGHRVALQLLGG